MITEPDLIEARAAYCREYGGHDPVRVMAGDMDWSPWIKGYARCRADYRIALAADDAAHGRRGERNTDLLEPLPLEGL